jgi:hypothetical protein
MANVVIRVRGSRNIRTYVVADNNNNNIQTTAKPATADWSIRKRYRVNPHTLADQPYNPDFYRGMIRAGSIESAKIQNWEAGDGEKIRAIQTMLHLQTNYNELLMRGFYKQPREVIVASLNAWYDEISDQFPQYRATCLYELRRHMTKYDNKADQAHNFRFVA